LPVGLVRSTVDHQGCQLHKFALLDVAKAATVCAELESSAKSQVDALVTQVRVKSICNGRYAMEPHAGRAAPDHHIAMLQRHARGTLGSL
jgi:hypothetical protein